MATINGIAPIGATSICLPLKSSSYLLPQSPLTVVMLSPFIVVEPHFRSNSNLNPQGSNPPSITRCGWRNPPPLTNRSEPYGQEPYFFGARTNDSRPNLCVRSALPQPHVIDNAFGENRRPMEIVPDHRSDFASRRKWTNQRGTSPTIKISNQNDGMVKKKEYHQDSPSSDYGLPEEWIY
ncbi:hypothetical protein RIF29_39646 [Crotalaria pallida]|uniref:Uncharacterized protein n=1 Tax=Crotalaria pallida TaxID=3830 RepID=A0AAN9E1K0_CROPI